MNKALSSQFNEPLPGLQHSIRPGMASTLSIALVSLILDPGNKPANLEKMARYAKEAAARGADIVVFPEASLTGFTVSRPATQDRPLSELYDWAETIPGPSVNRLMAAAQEYNIYIIMGMIEADSECIGQLYISAAFLGPEGLVGKYRKNIICDRGVFSEGKWGVCKGHEIPVWEIRQGWRIAIVICRDCWVPEVPRVAVVKGADLVLVHSYTPLYYEEAWAMLLSTRALENQTGFARVNCAGTYYPDCPPKEGIPLGGSRMAVEATGAVLVKEGVPDQEGMSIATFTAEKLFRARGTLPLLRDRNVASYRPLVEPPALARDVIPYKLRKG